MRPLTLSNEDLTREALLRNVEEIPGAEIGIRIAALLLMQAGLTSTQIAGLLGLSRSKTEKLIQKANLEGLEAVTEHPYPGRPSHLDKEVVKVLREILSKSPQDYKLPGEQWNGLAVMEYLRKFHNITIHVRTAQRIIKKLGHPTTYDAEQR